MSTKFVGGSSQCISAPAPVTDYPFTVGLWYFNTATTGGQYAWSLHDGGINCWFSLATSFSTSWEFSATNTGFGGEVTATAGTNAANKWFFIIVRAISPTNRRIEIYASGTGARLHAQETTSIVMSGITTQSLGCFLGGSAGAQNFMTGNIAEFWMTNADIQVDGAQLLDSTLLQLALGGPFSIPHIGASVVDYRSLRKHPTLDEVGETYFGGFGRQTWSVTGAPTTTVHPPLSVQYRKPRLIRAPLGNRMYTIYTPNIAVATGGFFSRYYYDMNGIPNV